MSSRSLRRPLSLLAAAAILAAGMLTGPLSPASAEGSKDDKIAERAEVDQRLEDLRIELNDVNDDLADTYLALAETEPLIPQAQQDLEDARVALGEAQEEDRKVGERLTEAEEEERRLSGEVETGQEEVDRSDDELATVALSAYKGGGMPSPSSVYVGNSSPQDAVDRSMNYRITMASQGTRLDTPRTDQSVTENSAERLSAVREEIKRLKIDAEEALERTRVAEEEATEAKNELDALYETQKTQRDDLEAKKTKYEGDQRSLETRDSTLDDEIEELAKQEREREEKLKAQQQQKSSGGSAPVAGSANTGGGWVYPVNARLNSNFGWRVHPIYGTKKAHAGVDFPVACGVPVGAAHSGRVIARTHNSGAGNKLIVSHGIMNGRLVTTSYHHLQGFAKPVGAQVSAGETVGYVGTTGSSTGRHLHFETHEDGNAVNPAKFL
ncbi:peptidoglycan DD-metalloendopeptidase family protein [Brachybacterium sp. GPGPB12]|uniref:peptidoglycan DD-metalloendopeptidase family protein n=1 Tax=Brachybacterium sp. GPGPB12 TaxID=3023517 RepID=UPI0031345363